MLGASYSFGWSRGPIHSDLPIRMDRFDMVDIKSFFFFFSIPLVVQSPLLLLLSSLSLSHLFAHSTLALPRLHENPAATSVLLIIAISNFPRSLLPSTRWTNTHTQTTEYIGSLSFIRTVQKPLLLNTFGAAPPSYIYIRNAINTLWVARYNKSQLLYYSR